MSCGIYKVTNKITGECYVGSSKNIEKRFKQHKQPCYQIRRPNSILYQAFQKYGLNNFSFEIIEECDESALYEREDYYIQNSNAKYNNLRAQHNSEKSRKEWYANYLSTPEYQNKKEYDKQWRAEHSDYMKNYKQSEEYKAKNREASKKYRERKKAEKLAQKQI